MHREFPLRPLYIVFILIQRSRTIYTSALIFGLHTGSRKRISRTTALSMCQLLGMNCATPTDFSFSLKGFVKRGGDTDIHSHGWGMCVYQGKKGAIRCFHDTLPACISPIAELVQKYPMQSCVRFVTTLWQHVYSL
jgi:hypothetical protein